MVLKSAFAAALCTGLLILGGPALADEYRAGELLGLDLSKAVLSPKRLGLPLVAIVVVVETPPPPSPGVTVCVIVSLLAARIESPP